MSPLIFAALAAPLLAQETARYRDLSYTDPGAPSFSAATAEEFQRAGGDDRFGVRVDLEITRNGVTRAARLGEAIYNGDGLSLRFTPSEDGYVYVVNRGTSGKWHLLYPCYIGNDNRITPDSAARIPDRGHFTVGGAPGDEAIYLLVSPSPLEDAVSVFSDTLGQAVAPWPSCQQGAGSSAPAPAQYAAAGGDAVVDAGGVLFRGIEVVPGSAAAPPAPTPRSDLDPAPEASGSTELYLVTDDHSPTAINAVILLPHLAGSPP